MKAVLRIISIIIVLSFATCLFAGCGKEKSRNEKARDKAVEICEKYLNFELSKEETKEQLNNIYDSLDVKESSTVLVYINSLIMDLTHPNRGIDDFTEHYETLKGLKYIID